MTNDDFIRTSDGERYIKVKKVKDKMIELNHIAFYNWLKKELRLYEK